MNLLFFGCFGILFAPSATYFGGLILRSQHPSQPKNYSNLFTLLCLSLILIYGCQKQRSYQDTQLLMGTFVEVVSPDKEAPKIVFAEIRRIENLLSSYKPESEVSRLNAAGELKVSPETFWIIKRSCEFSRASAGAFDITVAPLVDLWGFSNKNFRIPQEEEIKKVLLRVGWEKIVLQEKDNVVKFSLPGMKIDLGAIAKGYALDCAARKLKARGIKNCLINAGGQVYALGDKSGVPWRIGIRDPRKKEIRETLKLKNRSASTSGDYEQFFIKDGGRYAHIIDPKTGRPARSGIISVTVIAPEATSADALSTAMFVLGKEKAQALAKRFSQTEIRICENKDIKTP